MRKLKRTDARPRREGWQPVAPGIYEDAKGQMHLSIPELLALVDVEDTEENRRVLISAAEAVIAEQVPGVRVEVRE